MRKLADLHGNPIVLTPTELELFDTMSLKEQSAALNFWEACGRGDPQERPGLEAIVEAAAAQLERRRGPKCQ